MQAAMLSIRLKRLEDDNIQRRSIADMYLNEINNPLVQLPRTVEGTQSVWHLFVVRVEDRIGFMAHLERHSVNTLIHYPIPCHKQPCYSELASVECPVTERAATQIVSLPISPVLSDEQVRHVVTVINAWNR
jgi:dTDP-4-amino-4,6-dideoxygalactose transaminase